jgi:hypothetical protein
MGNWGPFFFWEITIGRQMILETFMSFSKSDYSDSRHQVDLQIIASNIVDRDCQLELEWSNEVEQEYFHSMQTGSKSTLCGIFVWTTIRTREGQTWIRYKTAAHRGKLACLPIIRGLWIHSVEARVANVPDYSSILTSWMRCKNMMYKS